MKKNTAIVFGITKNFTFALANVLIGMKKHCRPCWDDIIVYHDGVSQEEQKAINSIIPCEFVLFDEVCFKDGSLQTEGIKNYSQMAMARFECFDMLNEYHTIVWHDVDILVQKDFSSLLEYGKISGYAATQSSSFRVEQNFYGIMPGYDMFGLLYNSGIIVLHDTLPKYSELKMYCYDKYNAHADALRYPDQAVLNMMIQDYQIDVELIDLDYYCCHPTTKGYQNASIIHAYGVDKFWNSSRLEKQFPEWQENNKQWYVTKKQFEKESNGNPEVTVLMSVYERTDYLDDAVQSILNQTYTDFEFLIVVEYSSYQEQICKLLERYNDSRIVIIKNTESLGFSASLNIGMDAARGKYIARMDDDDIAKPERLEKEVIYLDMHSDVSVVGGWIQFFGNQNNIETRPLEYEELKVWALKECPMFHPTVMIRKEDFVKNNLRYNPEWLTEDYELWLRAIYKLRFANIPEVVHMYRAAGQNTTASKAQKVVTSHFCLMQRTMKTLFDLDFTVNEMQILRWPHLVNECYNSEDIRRMRESVVSRIYAANAEKHIFDQVLLEKYMGHVKYNLKAESKTALRKYPYLYEKVSRIYRWLMRKNMAKTDTPLLTRIKMRLLPPSSNSFHSGMASLESSFNQQQTNHDRLAEQVRMLDQRVQWADEIIRRTYSENQAGFWGIYQNMEQSPLANEHVRKELYSEYISGMYILKFLKEKLGIRNFRDLRTNTVGWMDAAVQIGITGAEKGECADIAIMSCNVNEDIDAQVLDNGYDVVLHSFTGDSIQQITRQNLDAALANRKQCFAEAGFLCVDLRPLINTNWEISRCYADTAMLFVRQEKHEYILQNLEV